MLPVRVKTENDDYIRRMITVSIADREDDLLCGLKTLIEWKAAVFYDKSEMMFDETKKKRFQKIFLMERLWNLINQNFSLIK